MSLDRFEMPSLKDKLREKAKAVAPIRKKKVGSKVLKGRKK